MIFFTMILFYCIYQLSSHELGIQRYTIHILAAWHLQLWFLNTDECCCWKAQLFKEFPFIRVAGCCSALLVDCCVLHFILRMVSLASAFERLDAHSSKPLVDCRVVLRYHCFCIFIQLNCVVQVEPKVLAAVGHDRLCSRWSHYHLCLSDHGVHRAFFLLWDGIERASCKWADQYLIRVRSHGDWRTRRFDRDSYLLSHPGSHAQFESRPLVDSTMAD